MSRTQEGRAEQQVAAYKNLQIKSPHKACTDCIRLRTGGAANQIRTGDLILTKDVLCLLSHSSKYILVSL